MLRNLAWAAFMMQLLFTVMKKKKTSWVSTNCFSLKLEIPVETGMFYHENTPSLVTWYSVPLKGQYKGFCSSLEACPSVLPIMMRPGAPLAQEIPHPGPRPCCLMESRLVLQGWIRDHGSYSAAEHVSVCCWIRPPLCISLSKERARATLI